MAWQDQMQEDPRNTIMVLVNYDGENLGEFRRNLATYGAVKVRSDSSGGGDVRTLQIEVNAENYQTLVAQFKKAIIENCMGYDAKDDRLGGNANEMNIKYSFLSSGGSSSGGTFWPKPPYRSRFASFSAARRSSSPCTSSTHG